jgi:hypothetical protein
MLQNLPSFLFANLNMLDTMYCFFKVVAFILTQLVDWMEILCLSLMSPLAFFITLQICALCTFLSEKELFLFCEETFTIVDYPDFHHNYL